MTWLRIAPSKDDLLNWADLVPTEGDLIFFDKRPTALMKSIGAPILTTDDVRAQSISIWGLSARSWYGYALNRASFAVFLPAGSLEKMKNDEIEEIGQIQLKLEVPSLIESENIPEKMKSRFIEVGKYRWITSRSFRSLTSSRARINMMFAWMRQNEIHSYRSMKLAELPATAKRTLKSVGLDQYLNTYSSHSGPNCLATVAAAVGANPALVDQWLHWLPLKSFLKDRGYRIVKTASAKAGDILVFMKNKTAIHAALYLGDDLYFEKPGQDFYEPFRVESFKRWKSEWPSADLLIFRSS